MDEKLTKRSYLGMAKFCTYRDSKGNEIVEEGEPREIDGYTFAYSADEIKVDSKTGRLGLNEYCDFDGDYYVVKEKEQESEKIGFLQKATFDTKYGNRL